MLLAARVAVAAALVVVLAHYIPPRGVIEVLRASTPEWLVVAALIVFAWRLIAARRLREFTRVQGMDVGTARLFAVSLISSFFGTVTPGYAVTGAVRWYLLSAAGRHKAGALAALFNDRLTDLAVMLGMGIGGLLLTQATTRPGLVAPALLLFGGFLGGWFALGSPWLTRLLQRLAPRLPRRVHAAAGRLIEALGLFARMPRRTGLRVLLLAIASNALNAFGSYCLMRALDLPLSYYDALWLRCAVFMVGTLPITLMGLGVREATVVALLAPAGIPVAAAVALSLLILTRDLFAAAAGGLALAAWRGPSPLQRPSLQV